MKRANPEGAAGRSPAMDRRAFLALGGVAAAGCSPAVVLNALAPDGLAREAGLAYGEGPSRRLDVYAPPAAGGPRPVVVFFYGGSWQNGKREDYRFAGAALAAEGFVAMVPDYRKYPEVRFPGFVEDGASAVAWARREAARFGGDPSKLWVMGHSAGAHIAALLALWQVSAEHWVRSENWPPLTAIARAFLDGVRSGELAEVLDLALDALLEKLEKQKFGKTSRPRKAKARGEAADPRHVPNEVRRVVTERDGEQCGFVSDDGVRCTERGFLELDHRTMVCRGGQPTAEEMRWRCRPHNQYEAERLLGADFMRAKREQARERRDRAHPAATAAARPTSPQPGRPPNDESANGSGIATDTAAGAETCDAEVTLALRGLGFAAAEMKRAMAATTGAPADTVEARLRAALAFLTPTRPFRCSEGAFEQLAWPLAIALVEHSLAQPTI